MASHDTVEEEIVVDASAARVWQALVDADQRRSWWSYIELEPVVGGRFCERWTASGQEVVTSGSVLELVPYRSLRMTWSDETWLDDTEVEISLAPSDLGTRVTVRQSGWDRLPDGQRLAEEHRVGWRMHLSHLRDHVEHDEGHDQNAP
ncbi:MAG: SRPBCC domain-containing protein [Actinomycetota bacterium]|nr:SRPBCC domain-containing protein [Actinomycetota bacterium]